jgi:hypothetical protein
VTESVFGNPCPGCDDAIRPYDPIDLFLERVWHRGCLDDWFANEGERKEVESGRRES